MAEEFFIDCRAALVAPWDALVLRTFPGDAILSMQISMIRPCPKGVNIDGLVILDMQDNGGLDNIEILYRPRLRMRTLTIPPREKERYWRLFVHANDPDPDIEVGTEESDREILFRIKPGEPDARYLIAPFTRALVAGNELIGFSLDVTELR